MIAKNKSGWVLHEHIKITENEISEYPNVTGAYAIVKIHDKYLIGYNRWRGQWEFPAGGIEEGESARQAAIRELFEETHQSGVELEFRGLFKCQMAHCGRYIPHFDFGEKLSPIVPYRHLPQILSGMTADCRSLV